MAQIKSSDQLIEIDVENGTAWKTLVCVSTGTLDGAAEVTSEETDCGIFTSTGSVTYTVTADAICETAPSVSQVTYQALLPKFINKSLVSVRIQNPVVGAAAAGTLYYHSFSARITALTLNKPSSAAYVSFSVTLQSDGAIDITA